MYRLETKTVKFPMNIEWHDTRVENPKPKSFDRYFVTFIDNGLVLLGIADWIPNEGYTSGSWGKITTTNGNQLEGEVLYWLDHPKKPVLI